jgi:hypothetical protein
MVTDIPSGDWPKRPYRGLDFYREADASVFRERDKNVKDCADILLGYGVKILILQGSSGSGKSSFLRAGLIPYLKQTGSYPCFLLNYRDSVIRCTSDPLPEIARSLLTALKSKKAFADGSRHTNGGDEGELIEEAVRSKVCHDLESATASSKGQLGKSLVDALVSICADLPGKLVLLLDQAEEVLTRTTDGLAADETAGAFFRFLEDVYLRNVDVRILVVMRTEYYGRFRDELRISDDRLSKRPKSGGIDTYLLRPLREKEELIRILEFPTKVRGKDEKPVYNFAFENGLVARIVDDLLARRHYASVTPALQVVCAILFERLTVKNRIITKKDYDSQGGLDGIIRSYVRRGLGVIGIEKEDEVDKLQVTSTHAQQDPIHAAGSSHCEAKAGCAYP